MDENLCIYFFRALIAFGVLALTNGQGIYGRGYGRRRFMPRRMYPRMPIGRGIIDPYPGGSIIGDPYVDPYSRSGTIGVYPDTGLGIIGGRRPAVISDRSSRDAQDINVSNNNVNREVNADSNNVVVNQATNTRTCECQTGDIMGGQCGAFQRCMPDSSCSGGGGNGVCRSDALAGGVGGFGGSPVMGGGMPFVDTPGGFVDSHGHGGMMIV